MWFSLKPTGIDFVESSRHKLRFDEVIAATPEEVFDVIVDGEGMRDWLTDFVDCRWTSKAPHGVGSTREIELKGLTVDERFLVWDRGRRVAFVMTRISVPIVRRLMEDIRLEPVGKDKTRLLWTVPYEPTLATRIVHPVVRAVFTKMFRRSVRQLSKRVVSLRVAQAA